MNMSFVEEEKEPTGDGARSERQEPKWRYVETKNGANVVAGPFVLEAHWLGTVSSEDIRATMRKVATAPDLYTFLQKIYLDYEDDCGCECNTETCCAVVGEPCAKCHASIALALVDGPSVTEGER